MPEVAEIHHPQQPDGIEEDSHDLPDVARAARRVRAYIAETGDGLYDVTNRRPLYARDLEALRRAGENLAELRATYDQARDGLSRQRDTLTRERDDAQANSTRLAGLLRETLAERDDARARADQLANALNRAASIRVDTRDVIWHPADAGRWQHPLYGVLDLDQIEAEYGRTRPALLVGLDDEPTTPDSMAALGPEITARRQIAAELDRLAGSEALGTAWLERHDLIRRLATPPAVLRAVAADVARGEVHGRRERWVIDGLVGSWVCAEPMPDQPDGICGMPVEDVPCTVHHPEPDCPVHAEPSDGCPHPAPGRWRGVALPVACPGYGCGAGPRRAGRRTCPYCRGGAR